MNEAPSRVWMSQAMVYPQSKKCEMLRRTMRRRRNIGIYFYENKRKFIILYMSNISYI